MKEEVQAALEEILASAEFAHLDRPSRFLRHLVETALSGENGRLEERALGIEFFHRDPSWDPVEDPVVRNEAGRLRNRLARYYASRPGQTQIHLPPGAYLPIFLPPGQEAPAYETPSSEWSSWWYLAAGVLIIAGLCAAWFCWGRFRLNGR